MLPLWRQLDPFLLPVVQGTAVGKDILDVTLIARRCNRRAGIPFYFFLFFPSTLRFHKACYCNWLVNIGTRMWRRGADSDGFVANFVESEQMIQLKSYTASFVQVRGSIPLLWNQIVDLTYKPKFEIMRIMESPRIVERHYLDLRKKYGNVLSIDLVNKHGGEGRLHEKFANAMQHVAGDDVRYLHFDFHHICGHVHFERLSILYDRIEDFFIKNRYFLISEKGEKVELQHGILRTNCIDCLDRTNVTQSMLGRKMLEFQLRRLGAFDAGESISSYPNLDESFKLLWANHGDDISIQYSGTPALKGDFVRFGHRTAQGVLADGCNALTRYYLNNFVDGTNQSFPLALGLILTGLFFAMLSLRNVGHGLRNLIYAIVWASISLGIAAYVRANGQMFCNRPSLHQSRR
ncbi:Phosphoinositide phosphatase SAC7 [Capsicum chinense]|nr:Phosphoinositide phosphatase SAC7 [Capsicum chinense]